MDEEKRVYIENKKMGKKNILLGIMIIVAGIFFIMGKQNILGGMVFLGGLGLMISGKIINWYHN